MEDVVAMDLLPISFERTFNSIPAAHPPLSVRRDSPSHYSLDRDSTVNPAPNETLAYVAGDASVRFSPRTGSLKECGKARDETADGCTLPRLGSLMHSFSISKCTDS